MMTSIGNVCLNIILIGGSIIIPIAVCAAIYTWWLYLSTMRLRRKIYQMKIEEINAADWRSGRKTGVVLRSEYCPFLDRL